jgi:NAD(P)-dependent dehydrogenase (short-subunit alcohol dehydrogenase family)
MRLENKVALITGGYGSMGRASARLFAKEGGIRTRDGV